MWQFAKVLNNWEFVKAIALYNIYTYHSDKQFAWVSYNYLNFVSLFRFSLINFYLILGIFRLHVFLSVEHILLFSFHVRQ